jgi:DNA-binding PadR family transcriptional regulator
MAQDGSGAGAVTVATTPTAWPNPLDVLPDGRCRFTVSPPRHFLYPAVLLLLAEEPRHGYALVDAVAELGLGRIDRPAVYRVLADLEADTLVLSWDEPGTAGSARHVYSITRKGQQVLESWMSVVAQERACLDVVLQRYWYCNAHRLPELDDAQAPAAVSARTGPADTAPPLGTGERVSFRVLPNNSNMVVEARSNVGPIAFATSALSGCVELHLRDGLVQEEPMPLAALEVRVSALSSGNALYDGELWRRADVRRFPTATLELRSLSRMGEGNCYQLEGDATVHGVTRRLAGVITATVTEQVPGARRGSKAAKRRLSVTGEYALDVRNFDMEVPQMPLLKIYPDVRLHLRLEAEAEGASAA